MLQQRLILLAVAVTCTNCDGTPHIHVESPPYPLSANTGAEALNICLDNDRCVDKYCEQVPIEQSRFRMGADKETEAVPPHFLGGLNHYGLRSPEHTRRLPGFCIDKYEVTLDRYSSCVAAGACDPTGLQWPDEPVPNSWSEVVVNHYPPECDKSRDKCPHHPVNCKTYQQAATYCRWIGRRLCTEAEWERAARGPLSRDRTPYPWGNAPIDERRANVPDIGPGHLVRVDACPDGVSVEGVFNLIGNVFEWVSDCYAPYKGAPEHCKYRIARGGCFFLKEGHNNTARLTMDPSFDWGCIGFRCCSDQSSSRR